MEGHRYTNRLINENSPYLQQYAHDPVEWYPWCDEALEHSAGQNKPIFLSIGYSTCHWCHMMQEESFCDPEIAQKLNAAFINIKVDREEMPDIDGLYMEFAQAMMAGTAGWPLNMVLTPDLLPLFAATYMPPEGKHGQLGVKELMQTIDQLWQEGERDRFVQQAEKILNAFLTKVHFEGEELPTASHLEQAAEQLFQLADPLYGGIKGAPKFSLGYQGNLMLQIAKTYSEGRAIFFVERTLDRMAQGGIHDHLGGGFARYSVDDKWIVPHFEKMLYDNAIIASSYIEAWRATKKNIYQDVAKNTIEFVLKDMTHKDGGFYSAIDSDSEGEEGKYYTWGYDEIIDILGKDRGRQFCDFYNTFPEGNFKGRNLLYMRETLEEYSMTHDINQYVLSMNLEEDRKKLLEARERRHHPFVDDMILSAWNGLMVHAMADAAFAFNSQRYIQAGVKAVQFIKDNMQQDGHLLRRWRNKEAKYFALLNDYVFMVHGLISLFEVDGGTEWLEWAIHLTKILEREFRANQGAFFVTDGLDPNIIIQRCVYVDSAEPSGNGVHCENLLRLYQITHEEHYLEQAEGIIKAVKPRLDQYVLGHCYHLLAIGRYYDRNAREIVIALDERDTYKNELFAHIGQRFIPNKVVIWRRSNDKRLLEMSPALKKYGPVDGKTALYICHFGNCEDPITELPEMMEAINNL